MHNTYTIGTAATYICVKLLKKIYNSFTDVGWGKKIVVVRRLKHFILYNS